MSSNINSTTTTTMNHRGSAVSQSSFSSIHPDIVKAHILNKLDAKSLGSTSCVSTELKNLCNGENLWKDVCNNTWPSCLDPLVQTHIKSHRVFFSDAYSVKIPRSQNQELDISMSQNQELDVPKSQNQELEFSKSQQNPKSKKLISAVDIFYEDKVIFSKSILTEPSPSWFSFSPFKIDVLEDKDVVPTMVKITGDENTCISALEKSLKLSWILIDCSSKRALNISSMYPVSVRRHWLSREIQIRYAMVVRDSRDGEKSEALVQCGVVVSCREDEEMHVKEISLIVEDNEGLILDGNEGFEIVQEVVNGERRKKSSIEERKRYEKFVKMKTDLSEMKQRKEKRLDMFVVFTGVSVFMSLCMLLLST